MAAAFDIHNVLRKTLLNNDDDAKLKKSLWNLRIQVEKAMRYK